MGVLADVRLYLCVWHPHLLRQIHSLDFFLFSSKYELPKRKKTASLLTKLYSKKYDELVRDLAKIDHVALTSDIWTSRAVQIFQTITCHYITPSWEMKSVVLETVEMAESHTAENIASALQKGVERFGTKEKIVAIATDNAANVVAAVRDLGCNRVACFAHTLNLIDSKRSWSVKDADKLKSFQANLALPEHKLIQDVETRWNSTFLMLSLLSSWVPSTENILSTFNRKRNEYLQQKTYWVPSTENRKHIEYVQQKTENRLRPTTENRKHIEYVQQKTYWIRLTENIMSTFDRKHIQYLQQKT